VPVRKEARIRRNGAGGAGCLPGSLEKTKEQEQGVSPAVKGTGRETTLERHRGVE